MREEDRSTVSVLCSDRGNVLCRDSFLYVASRPVESGIEGNELFELFGLSKVEYVPEHAQSLESQNSDCANKEASSDSKKEGQADEAVGSVSQADQLATKEVEDPSALKEREAKCERVVFQRLLMATRSDALLHNGLLNHDFLVGRPKSSDLKRHNQQQDEKSEVADADAEKESVKTSEEDKKKTPTSKKKHIRAWKKSRILELRKLAHSSALLPITTPYEECLSVIVQRAIQDRTLQSLLISVHVLLEAGPDCKVDALFQWVKENLYPYTSGLSSSSACDVAALIMRFLGVLGNNYIQQDRDPTQRDKTIVHAHPLTFVLLYSLLSSTLSKSSSEELKRHTLRVLTANFYNLLCAGIAPASVGLGHSTSGLQDLFVTKLCHLVRKLSCRPEYEALSVLCWTVGLSAFYPSLDERYQLLEELLNEDRTVFVEAMCARLSTDPLPPRGIYEEPIEDKLLSNILAHPRLDSFPSIENDFGKGGEDDDNITDVGEDEDEDEEEALLRQALALSLNDNEQHEAEEQQETEDAKKTTLFRLRYLSSLIKHRLDVSSNPTSQTSPHSSQSQPAAASNLVLEEARCAETIQLSQDGRSATQKSDKEWGTALARLPMTKEGKIYKWSVKLDRCEKGHVFIGVATKYANSSTYLGGDKNGWGLIGTKVLWHNRAKIRSYGFGFRSGDVITVTLDTVAGTLSYTSDRKQHQKNSDWGVAFRNLNKDDITFYPAIALYQRGDSVTLLNHSSGSTENDCDIGGVNFHCLNFSPYTRSSNAELTTLNMMAAMNKALCKRKESERTDPYVVEFLEQLSNLLERKDSAVEGVIRSTLLNQILATLALYSQRAFGIRVTLQLLRIVLRLFEILLPMTRDISDNMKMDGKWVVIKKQEKPYEIELVQDGGSINASRDDVTVAGMIRGNKCVFTEKWKRKNTKCLVTMRLMPGGTMGIGTYNDGGRNRKLDIVAYRSDEESCKNVTSDRLSTMKLLGVLGGKLSAALVYGFRTESQDAAVSETDYLLNSHLLEGGFSQKTVDAFLREQCLNEHTNMLIALSGYTSTGNQEESIASSYKNEKEVEEWGLESSVDVNFVARFCEKGVDPLIDTLDQWMLRFAGKSAFLSVGGSTMRTARLATIAAMLVHTGLLQEARLLSLWLSGQETASSKDDDNSAEPSRMLISVWKAAQRIIEWTIRAKQQSGSTYAVLGEKLYVKARFLLRIRPQRTPMLDFSLRVQKKDTSSQTPLRVDTAALPPVPPSATTENVSVQNLVTADFIEKLADDDYLVVLEQWKRVAKYVTRRNFTETHSQALESVVLFLKGNVRIKQLDRLILDGAWRALQRAAGYNVFFNPLRFTS
mmetsp:Transcript_23837/g.51853  ORF Transcript_23837/g.51853 Transcript_23837/m.51853 type:complete len:1341 (-) Transcript_23837:8811-12833(-)